MIEITIQLKENGKTSFDINIKKNPHMFGNVCEH